MYGYSRNVWPPTIWFSQRLDLVPRRTSLCRICFVTDILNHSSLTLVTFDKQVMLAVCAEVQYCNSFTGFCFVVPVILLIRKVCAV